MPARDTINRIKQAAEFGITRRGMKLAALLMFITDVHALGLQTAQGLMLTETFYWDLNDRTRAFTDRVRPKMPSSIMPTMVQAGCYAAALHYLKAVGRHGRGGGQGGWRGGGRAHEGDADRRRLLRPGPHPRGWPQAPSRPICSR